MELFEEKNTIEVQFPKLSQPVNRMGMPRSPNVSLSSDDSSMDSLFSFSNSSIENNSPKRHIESPTEEFVSKRANVCLHSDDSSAASVFSSSDSSEEQKQSIEKYSPTNYIKLYTSEESMSGSPNVSLLSDDSSMGSLCSFSDPSDQQKETIVHNSKSYFS